MFTSIISRLPIPCPPFFSALVSSSCRLLFESLGAGPSVWLSCPLSLLINKSQ